MTEISQVKDWDFYIHWYPCIYDGLLSILPLNIDVTDKSYQMVQSYNIVIFICDIFYFLYMWEVFWL